MRSWHGNNSPFGRWHTAGGAVADEGLLDRFSDAAAAYSLRKLSNSTTNVVRVRRSADNAELDFTPDDINDGSLLTWVGAGDGFVTTWYDQSGNANHATQATASSQPKVVDGGVLVTEDGKPAIKYNGASTRLLVQSFLFGQIQFYLFSVNNILDTDTQFPYYYGTRFDDPGFYIAYISSRELPLEFNVGGPGYRGSRSSILLDNQFIFSGFTKRDNSYPEFYVDGSFAVVETGENDNVTGTFGDYPLQIGRTLGGTISETIFYFSDQSDNRADIEANIADYYGITLT